MTGSEWLKAEMKVTPSPLGARVADMLGWVFGGLYHLPKQKIDWTNDHHIVVLVDSLATWDSNSLTMLVLACHEACLRLEIGSVDGRNAARRIELMFHARVRDGGMGRRHPSVEQAVQEFQRQWDGSLTWEVTE